MTILVIGHPRSQINNVEHLFTYSIIIIHKKPSSELLLWSMIYLGERTLLVNTICTKITACISHLLVWSLDHQYNTKRTSNCLFIFLFQSVLSLITLSMSTLNTWHRYYVLRKPWFVATLPVFSCSGFIMIEADLYTIKRLIKRSGYLFSCSISNRIFLFRQSNVFSKSTNSKYVFKLN